MKYLIVVDMQEDFVNGCLGSEAARAIVKPLTEYVRDFDGRVIFTMDTHGENYSETQEGKRLPVKHCVKGSGGWRIIRELEAYAGDCVEKPAFGSVSLAERLREENAAEPVESIELAGVCTSICVISNALLLKAFLPETPIRVKACLCACVSEESHRAALTAMETAQIEIER